MLNRMTVSVFTYDVILAIITWRFATLNFELARFCHILSDLTDFLFVWVTFHAESNGVIRFHI